MTFADNVCAENTNKFRVEYSQDWETRIDKAHIHSRLNSRWIWKQWQKLLKTNVELVSMPVLCVGVCGRVHACMCGYNSLNCKISELENSVEVIFSKFSVITYRKIKQLQILLLGGGRVDS